MNISSSYFKKMDWWLLGSSVLIACFGLAGIYSASLAKSDFSNFQKQLIFFVVGIMVMLAMSFFDYRLIKNNPYLLLTLYGICLLLLAGLHFFAPVIRGTRGWYKFGILTLDPIEPVKIVLIMLLAKYFSMRHVEMHKFKHIIFSGLYVLLPAVLIFIKPDLGGTMVLVLAWLGILMVSGIKIKHVAVLLLCFAIVAGAAWMFLLHDYQKQRIISFLFPYDVLGGSWSQTQTKIAIGAGQVFGKGIFNDSQVQYGFLPEPHTDFIFSVIGEQWGLIGMVIFFTLYAILVWRILVVALEAESNFPRIFAVGIAVVFISQFTINIGMNLALLPVVGIYLPLVSYGGSGLIATFISLGILQSMKLKR